MGKLSAGDSTGALVLAYEDAHLLVLDKPSGLLSVPGRGPDKQDCLSARVQSLYPDALVVHRLDMATSGLFVMVRSAQMQRLMSRAFAERAVQKRYTAVVAGHLQQDAGVIDLPIAADWPQRPLQMIDHERGKPSRTHWRVLARQANGTTRLELEPETGRTHQLRVHLKAMGHPILGDALYAPAAVQAMAPRLALHASELGLNHPASGEALVFKSATPF